MARHRRGHGPRSRSGSLFRWSSAREGPLLGFQGTLELVNGRVADPCSCAFPSPYGRAPLLQVSFREAEGRWGGPRAWRLPEHVIPEAYGPRRAQAIGRPIVSLPFDAVRISRRRRRHERVFTLDGWAGPSASTLRTPFGPHPRRLESQIGALWMPDGPLWILHRPHGRQGCPLLPGPGIPSQAPSDRPIRLQAHR
jgi:hypothetical protein